MTGSVGRIQGKRGGVGRSELFLILCFYDFCCGIHSVPFLVFLFSRNRLSCLRFSIPIHHSSTRISPCIHAHTLVSILLFMGTLSHTSSDMRLYFLYTDIYVFHPVIVSYFYYASSRLSCIYTVASPTIVRNIIIAPTHLRSPTCSLHWFANPTYTYVYHSLRYSSCPYHISYFLIIFI